MDGECVSGVVRGTIARRVGTIRDSVGGGEMSI